MNDDRYLPARSFKKKDLVDWKPGSIYNNNGRGELWARDTRTLKFEKINWPVLVLEVGSDSETGAIVGVTFKTAYILIKVLDSKGKIFYSWFSKNDTYFNFKKNIEEL